MTRAAVGDFPVLCRAPGRVNIIGEHTDYTEGFVLPTTTAAYTWVSASPRADRMISVRSVNLDNEHAFSLDNIEKNDEPEWFDYVKGVVAMILADDVNLCGADLVIDSEIPMGGGLSSSAALEVAVAIALLRTAQTDLPPARIAHLCRRAEIEYAGVNCGVMDQMAITSCKYGNAMLLDCRNLESEHVRLPGEIRFLLTDSGVKHKLPDGEYNQRASECAIATKLLAQQDAEMTSLRDLTADDINAHQAMLGDKLYRRCRHVVSENQRVLDAFTALASADFATLGELVSASHESLRDDFEVSCEEIESLVQIADSCDGVLGSRIMGAGFGGCVLSVISANALEQSILKIRRDYLDASGVDPWMHVVTPTDAAATVEQT